MIKVYRIITVILLCGFTYSGKCQPCVNPASNNCSDAIAGTSRFLMSTSGNVDFEFNDMREYINGITHSGSTQLRLKVDEIAVGFCKWKLFMYIDNNGFLPNNEWEPLNLYSATGIAPELDLIEVKVYNGCGTPLMNGIFQIFAGCVQYDILDIIPDVPRTMPGPCDGSQINGPGSFLTDYNEYNFNIDYRIKPGYTLKSGAYQIKIHFCLSEAP